MGVCAGERVDGETRGGLELTALPGGWRVAYWNCDCWLGVMYWLSREEVGVVVKVHTGLTRDCRTGRPRFSKSQPHYPTIVTLSLGTLVLIYHDASNITSFRTASISSKQSGLHKSCDPS